VLRATCSYRLRERVGVELEQLSLLLDGQRVGVDARDAVLRGLPRAPPAAGEVEVLADLVLTASRRAGQGRY
jgi:hypothetical protein